MSALTASTKRPAGSAGALLTAGAPQAVAGKTWRATKVMTSCTKATLPNNIVKVIPRVNHDVFQALVKGGIVRQKRKGFPKYIRCRGTLRNMLITQAASIPHQLSKNRDTR